MVSAKELFDQNRMNKRQYPILHKLTSVGNKVTGSDFIPALHSGHALAFTLKHLSFRENTQNVTLEIYQSMYISCYMNNLVNQQTKKKRKEKFQQVISPRASNLQI